MILYFENSHGLGNNLIELSVLNTLYPDKTIYFFTNSPNLFPIFNLNIKVLRFKKSYFQRAMFILLKRFLKFLTDLKIISLICEIINLGNKKIINKKGLFKNIFFVSNKNHFQIPAYLNNLILPFSLKLNDNLIEKEIDNNKTISKVNFKKTCFIHIRRGDYISWPSKKYPAVLSFEWYKSAISIMKNKYKINRFLIFTDDVYFAKDCFMNETEIKIINFNPLTDLFIMSKCRYGILSASSFSWFAAKISKIRYLKYEQFFLAPKFWAGHRKKEWYPSKFRFKWINYI